MLDVGARDCSNSFDFVDKGFRVDAIDIKDEPVSCKKDNINYQKISFEDFSSDKKYDVIVARHVLPFLSISIEKSLEKLFNFLQKDGVLYFSVFGKKDDWSVNSNVFTKNLDEVHEMVGKYATVSYESEEQYVGPTYSGDIKNWHVITMVVVKK